MIDKNEHGIRFSLGNMSDNTSSRLVYRSVDGAIFLEGHRLELKPKRNQRHYFLQNLSESDLREMHDAIGQMLKQMKKDWAASKSKPKTLQL